MLNVSKEEREAVDRVIESIIGGRNKAREVQEDENAHEACLCHVFRGKEFSNTVGLKPNQSGVMSRLVYIHQNIVCTDWQTGQSTKYN